MQGLSSCKCGLLFSTQYNVMQQGLQAFLLTLHVSHASVCGRFSQHRAQHAQPCQVMGMICL